MSRQIVAGRYAGALFALAKEQNLLEPVEKDLRSLADALAANPELGLILENRQIGSGKKFQLLSELFGKHFQELTLNFLGVVLEKRREAYLEEIVASFQREMDEFRGIMEAEIRTAVELPEESKKALAERLTKTTGKEVRLKYRVEPDLLAGAVLKIGDKVIDGSIATRLKNLQAELSG
ncbi:MAG: F0F1 ATP synthase subunit delta [Clostridia bacterium]|jgi:F-type H+-transporting ATPase subunit delta|nr:F0F1 ATP synthase subunit delta [Clostridia bacterium]